MSAKDLIPWMSILAAVKALTLTATLLRFCDWRVAVTMISPTWVAPAAAEAGDGAWAPAFCALAPALHATGTSAAPASQGRRRACRFAMSSLPPDWASGSYPADPASRL